jgi:hypothetical protein
MPAKRSLDAPRTNGRRVIVLALLAACGGDRAPEPRVEKPADKPALAPAPAPAPALDAGVAEAKPAPPDAKPVPPPAPAGQDFIKEARALYRIVGCAEGPMPAELADPRHEKAVDRHCKIFRPLIEKYRREYFTKAGAWFAQKVPADATQLVYLFSGADLLSALVAFPNATEITTSSLELAGDPRPYAKLKPEELDRDLAGYRDEQGLLIQVGSNSSKNLSKQQVRSLPGQVSSFMLALSAGGFEPVAMRFFRVEPDGKLHYFDAQEIEADTARTTQLKPGWNKPAFAESFRHVEVQYKKLGETTMRTHRHIAWNVEDKFLAENPGLLRHLEAKGKVNVLVKGGSYLLWFPSFSTIRNYILGHLKFMLSDSTGVSPTHARPAGMIQEAYGRYTGPVDEIKVVEGKREDLDMKALFAKPIDKMPFRYGYLDKANNNHVVITKPR